jgi:NitT/TauT family transport system substrate-binding protein
VALDDCLGSVRATLTFVYNDHTQQFGWGKESAERLAFTWKAVADAQELKADWDYKQAIDTSLVEK